jgi:hypothetical protein
MYTRESFERQRAAMKKLENREGLLLAAVSVGLGVGQLILIRWAERHLEHGLEIRIEGGVFLAYLALVGWMIWRMQRRLRAARPACPQCKVPLQGMSERIAAATGKCDSCGGQVIE